MQPIFFRDALSSASKTNKQAKKKGKDERGKKTDTESPAQTPPAKTCPRGLASLSSSTHFSATQRTVIAPRI